MKAVLIDTQSLIWFAEEAAAPPPHLA